MYCDYCDLCVGTHTKDTDIDEIYIKIVPKMILLIMIYVIKLVHDTTEVVENALSSIVSSTNEFILSSFSM